MGSLTGFFHFLSELAKTGDNTVDDGFGLGRATGYIDIHRDDFVNAANDVVGITENATGIAACADGDDGLGLRHLIVDVLENLLVPVVDGALTVPVTSSTSACLGLPTLTTPNRSTS